MEFIAATIEYRRKCPKCGCPGFGYAGGSGCKWIFCAKCMVPYDEG